MVPTHCSNGARRQLVWLSVKRGAEAGITYAQATISKSNSVQIDKVIGDPRKKVESSC